MQFAREIMQLFSVGLYQMSMDGSAIIDDTTGFPMETYNIYGTLVYLDSALVVWFVYFTRLISLFLSCIYMLKQTSCRMQGLGPDL